MQCGKVRMDGLHLCCAGQQLPGPESKGKPGAGLTAAGGQNEIFILQRAPWLPWGETWGVEVEAGTVKRLPQCLGKRG